MFENEGHTENGCKTPKIGVWDHLFDIFVLYTLERFTSFIFVIQLPEEGPNKSEILQIIIEKSGHLNSEVIFHYLLLYLLDY